MNRFEIDLSNRRFHPVWLFLGAIVGRAAGLVLGLNLGFWYQADPRAVFVWQLLGAFAGALFYSFLMTSSSPVQTKGAILGLGSGFSLALYGAEIWASLQHDRVVHDLTSLTYAEGIYTEWLMIHSAWLGLAIGWIAGALIARKIRRAQC